MTSLLYDTHLFFYLQHMSDSRLLRANSLYELKQAPASADNVSHITKTCVSVSYNSLII